MSKVKFDLVNNINEREIIMSEERLDVLDKIKELVMLKGTEYMTTEMVANYYNVPEGTIRTVIRRNKEELIKNGFNKYSKDEILRNIHCEYFVKQEKTRNETINAYKQEMVSIKSWLNAKDYIINKHLLGEYSDTDTRWVNYLTERKLKLARYNELETLLVMM